jgi:hypothetical protein
MHVSAICGRHNYWGGLASGAKKETSHQVCGGES